MLEHGARAQIPQLGLNERPQIPWRTMLNAKNRMQIIIMLDDHSGAELGCGNTHYLKNLLK